MGLAIAAVSLRGVDLRLVPIPLAVFVPQTVLIITSAVGFRHAVRVPADPRANWHFIMSWSGDERPYLSGVKRAALVRLTLPILLALLPVHVVLLGPAVALAHFACGLLIGILLLELLLLDLRRLPFVSSFTPAENLWGWAVIYLLAFLGERVRDCVARAILVHGAGADERAAGVDCSSRSSSRTPWTS